MVQPIENHLSAHKKDSYSKHPIQHPNAPRLSEDSTEQILVQTAEIGDTLSKEPTITSTPQTQCSKPVPFLSAIFNWSFSNSFYARLS
jgi:hypothetical protein